MIESELLRHPALTSSESWTSAGQDPYEGREVHDLAWRSWLFVLRMASGVSKSGKVAGDRRSRPSLTGKYSLRVTRSERV